MFQMRPRGPFYEGLSKCSGVESFRGHIYSSGVDQWGVVDSIGETPRLEELLVHGSLVAEQVEAYPLEDSLVNHPEHRQVDLEVRLPEYIW